MNDRYKAMMGREVDNPAGKPALLVVHPDDREPLMAEIKNAITQERDVSYDIRILYGESEYRAYHLEGRIVEREEDRISIYATYMLLPDDEMSFREMLPVILNAIMKSTTDLAFVKDKNLIYMCCSEAFVKMVGAIKRLLINSVRTI